MKLFSKRDASTQQIDVRRATDYERPDLSDGPYDPHTDVQTDEIGIIYQTNLTLRNVAYVLCALLVIVPGILGAALWQESHKPVQTQTLVITKSKVAIVCDKRDKTRTHACPKGQTQDIVTLSALQSLQQALQSDPDAKYAVANYFLPVFIRGAFTNTTVKADADNIKDFVRPFLWPQSQAATYFENYYSKDDPSQYDSQQSTQVTVLTPIPRSDDGHTFYVSWTTTAYNANGQNNRQFTAKIDVLFGDGADKNIGGMYIDGFQIVNGNATTAAQPPSQVQDQSQ